MPRDLSKHWDIGVTGAVVRVGTVLFVQRNYEPNKGTWTLPGGYAEHTETLDEAVKRELKEETGIEIEVKGVIAVRTRYGEKGGAVLVVFRAEVLSGEPHADMYEISAAEFFDAEQIAKLDPVFPLSREVALRVLKSDSIGLTEREIPSSSNPIKWKAFTI
jgi:ADP-ribose pyrophosphatase YjhB (NUDIX family)